MTICLSIFLTSCAHINSSAKGKRDLSNSAVEIEIAEGVKAQIEKVYPEKIQSEENVEDRYILKIGLGKLSLTKFKSLKKNTTTDPRLPTTQHDPITYLTFYLHTPKPRITKFFLLRITSTLLIWQTALVTKVAPYNTMGSILQRIVGMLP